MKRIFSVVLLIVLGVVLTGCDQLGLEFNKAPVVEGEESVTYSIYSEVPDWKNLITVTDEEDGEVSVIDSMIESDVDFTTIGTYEVKFHIEDSGGKTTQFILRVEIIDSRVGTFSLIGDSEITIEADESYTEPGVVALDIEGVEMDYRIDGSVDSTTVGVYDILYSIDGVKDPLVRTVTVNYKGSNVVSVLPEEDITIEFWHVYGQGRSALLNKLIADFEIAYPTIKVDSRFQGSYRDLLSKTNKAIGIGITPNLIVGYPVNMAEYINRGALISLDSFVGNTTWGIDLNDFIPSYIAENKQLGGRMYSLPYSKTTEVLMYNKTLFTANGYEFTDNQILTWEEIDTMSNKMVGNGANQCEFLINYDSSSNLFITASSQWGAGYTNATGDVLIDNAKTKGMLNYFSGLIDNNVLALPIQWGQGFGSENFLAQDVCMTVGSTVGTYYNDPSSHLSPGDQFDVGVLPIPQFEGKTQSALQQGPNIAIMANSNDAERLASWIFLTFLTNAQNTAAWAIDTSYLPVRQSGYDSAIYQEFLNNPNEDYSLESESANAAYSQIHYNKFDLAFAGIGKISSFKVREEAGYAIKAIYIGTKTVDEAIQEMLDQLAW